LGLASTDTVTRIRRLSLPLEYACYSVIAIWFVGALYISTMVWVAPEQISYLFGDLGPLVVRIGQANLLKAIPAWLMLMVTPAALNIYGYWHLSQVFRSYKKQIFFSNDNARHLFHFALAGFLGFIATTPLLGLADAILTLATSQRAQGMPLVINGDEVSGLIAWGAFLTVSWVMREGTRIAQENAEIL
jgi:hypothetical protein